MDKELSRSSRRGWVPFSLTILLFVLASGALALNPTGITVGDRAGLRSRVDTSELARQRTLIWEDAEGHRVYRVSAKGLTRDEIAALEAAGEVQWCWKRRCEHWMIDCEGGTATDVDGCTVKCSWSGSGTTVTVSCPGREAEAE
jgi:hypothetical protein